MIIGGDYNAKHPMRGSRLTNSRGRERFKVLTRHGYEALSSSEPTYWPSHRHRIPDTIDFFVFRGVSHSQCRVSTVADLSSDHVPVILSFSWRPLPLVKDLPLVLCYTDWDNFCELVTMHSKHTVAITTTTELDYSIQHFTHLVQQAVEQSTPPLPPPTSSARLSVKYQALFCNRHAARKRWQRVRSESSHCEYRTSNNLVKEELRVTRNDSLATFF